MSRIMEKIYALFRMNILIFVLLAATVIALFAYQNGLDDIVFLNLSDYPYVIAEQRHLSINSVATLPTFYSTFLFT